jgi:hypothetical protein
MFKANSDVLGGNPSGFQMTFPNGWTASVQWGRGTYSSNRDSRSSSDESQTAEVWAWDGGEGKYPHPYPKGWQSVPQVLAFLNEVSLLGVPEFIKEKS